MDLDYFCANSNVNPVLIDMVRVKALLVIGMLCFVFFSQAKDNENFVSYSSSVGSIGTLKVFLEGNVVDFNYIRRNINFVDFVNDPKTSDVHIIVTSNRTGGGGTNYILNYYSQNLSHIGDISLNCVSMADDTDDERRACVLKTLKAGLMPYVNETDNSNDIDIVYHLKDEKKQEKTVDEDPWNKWVFRMDASGGFDFEESKNKYNYSFNVRADRVTEKIKMRAQYYMRDRFEEIETEGTLVYSNTTQDYARLRTVYSLSDRLSTGLFLSYFQSTYWNTKSSYDVKPAIEYNFFPWEEADKRRFTISYFAGFEGKDYYETTIFGKDAENLWEHNLELNFELVQPWGEIETRLEGASYWHDFSKNKLTFQSDLSLRIVRGLSVNFSFRAENIHNQLYLPAGEVSLEDILLGNQKLPSTYEIWGSMGLRIQFGSIYNNVINNRL